MVLNLLQGHFGPLLEFAGPMCRSNRVIEECFVIVLMWEESGLA